MLRDDPNAASGIDPKRARSGRLKALAFLNDPESEALVRRVLEEVVKEGVEVRRGDVVAATKSLQKMPSPRALIVDVHSLERPADELDALAHVCEPDTRVLVVGDRDDLTLYRLLVHEFGVREYLFKPLSRDVIVRFFCPHIVDSPIRDTHVRGGRVVAMVGARGGSGTSTVALGVAVYLGSGPHRHTLLADLNPHSGTLALMAGVKAGGGMRAALDAPDRLDALFIDRSAVALGDRVDLLASEEALEDAVEVRPEAVRKLVDFLRLHYNIVIVDLPSVPGPAYRTVLEQAHMTIVVAQPTLSAARDAQRILKLASGTDPSQGSRFVVLNRLGEPGLLSRKDFEAALGRSADFVVPYLPKVIPVAETLGKLPVTQRSPFRGVVATIANEIAVTRDRPEPAPRIAAPAKKAGLLSRMFARSS